jgi:methylmalonyl-CoA decarboxylase
MSFVIESIANFVGTVTLNHPKEVNPLGKQLIDEIAASLKRMEEQRVRVVILRARPGARVFSAGHDVGELPLHGRDPLTRTDPLGQAVRNIQLFPAPVIALVEGSVWGGACELVMGCDLVVAGSDTTFAITPAKLGVPYNIVGTLNLLNIAATPLVKQMLFTAQPVSAERLLQFGVLNYVLPRQELESFTFNLAAQIAENSPLVIQALKEEIRLLEAAHPLVPAEFERVQALRRRVYDSADYQEGIKAFFEKRKPAFRGE